jgi:hypothetical protein
MDRSGNDTQSIENDRKYSKYLLRLRQMIITWWRSRSWEPERYKWKISNFGNITIVRESSGNYVASITTTLTYINTDDRCPLDISPNLTMYIPHIGSGREGDYYTLITQDLGIQRVTPDGSLSVEHIFNMRTNNPPLLSGTARCIIRGNVTGAMEFPAGVVKGKLTLDGDNTFDTRVTKEWIPQ